MASPSSTALSGFRVIDLGQIYAGPYAGFLLAMAGADVVKVEPPGGEFLRGRSSVAGGTVPFAMLNACKRAITLNLKSDRGRELLLELVKDADVVLENYSPDTMDRLGLGWETLRKVNPRLVYASGSGYGRTGPNRHYPAMDLTIQAMSGVMSVTGFPESPPVKAGPAIADYMGGIHLYAAIVTALLQRSRTGEGQLVEVSLQEAIFSTLSSNLGLYFSGQGTLRTGNRHGGLASAPYNVYPSKNGHIAIICVSEKQWQTLTDVMGHPELKSDEKFSSLKGRVANMAELDEIIGAWSSTLSKEEAFERLISNDVPSSPVRDLDEVVNDEHMHERGMLRRVDHPRLGRLILPGSPLHLHGADRPTITESPDLGQHNNEIYHDWLGLSAREIEDLKANKVI
jgi:crotonobetainyl-CoA:carnitine CoA-transferase CaiB-like acyl-CoA transferase